MSEVEEQWKAIRMASVTWVGNIQQYVILLRMNLHFVGGYEYHYVSIKTMVWVLFNKKYDVGQPEV